MSLFLIILAAGNSKRLKSATPKPFHKIKNITLLEHTINSFKNIQEIKKTVIVFNEKHKKYLNKLKLKNVIKIQGGKNRQKSTFLALSKIKRMNCKKVLIHDAARPFPPEKLKKKKISKQKKNHAVVPITRVNDATKRIKKNTIFKNIERDTLRFAQTPQGFTYKKIYEKHKKNINEFFDDDSALFTNDKEKIVTVEGSKKNIKITDREDLNIFESFKSGKTSYGIGFDVHRLIKSNKLYLGGIKIRSSYGLKGHSDGDAIIHSIIDSLLGACRLGDIGKLFPDKNKKYKNIRSTILLKKVVNLIEEKKFSINNIDVNVIIQKPKIKKYSKRMTNVISKICKINFNQVNIKGKTTEKLGLIGKGKAIACEAITAVTKHD